MSAVLEARDAGKWFHAGTGAEVRAVDGVSVAVGRGDFLLLRGPSGSGKTTLLALLGTLERPTRGSVLVDGVDAAGLSDGERSRVRRRIGFAFPGGPMIPRLPLWENVTYGLVAAGRGAAERRGIAEEVLARVGLAGKLRAAAEELSTGELQRATLARALAGTPDVLLVDEPLSNLDAGAAGRVAGALEAFHRAGGTAVVASHAVDPFPFATGTVRMEAGRLVDQSR